MTASGPVTPTSDEALTTVDAAQGSKGQGATDKLNSPSAPHAGQALRVIEGERKAANFLARLHAQQADPDELALIVRHEAWCGMAYGESLACVCNPTTELVDADTLATTMARDFKNRAQRRAAAKEPQRAKP